MNMEKVNVEIPESEAGKGRGSGTGSAATPSIAVGGQEVEKTGQKAIGSVDKVERKEEKAVEKVKSKGTDKLEIRRPIARFGPLRGTNLVTINKRKGKIGENYTLSTPVYTVYFQSNNGKKDSEKEKRKVLYSTAASKSQKKGGDLPPKNSATTLGASSLVAANKNQNKGGNLPPKNLPTTLGASSLVAEPACLGASSLQAKNTENPPVLAPNPAPGSGEPLGNMKALSNSLDDIEEKETLPRFGGGASGSSDADSESDGTLMRPRGAPGARMGETSDTDGLAWNQMNRQQRKNHRRAIKHQQPEKGEGHPTTSTPNQTTKPPAKRTRHEANLTNEPENDNNKKTEPPKKKDKMSYAQAVRSALPMVEIRASDPNISLEQEDFVHIDNQTFLAMITEVEDSEDSTDDDWDVKEDKGVAHGACWFICGNQATVDNFIKLMKNIKPPEGKNYSYLTYDPENRPYRYFTVRTRTEFASMTKEQLARGIKRVNPFMKKKVTDPLTGESREYHIRSLGPLPPREGVKTDPNYTVIKLEVEELLFQPLIEKKGWIKIGMNPYRLQGGGLAEAIKTMENAEKEGNDPARSLAAGLESGLNTDRQTETSDNNA